MTIDLQQSARLINDVIKDGLKAANDEYADRVVMMARGKYKGHKAKINGAEIQYFRDGYEYMFYVKVRDRKDERFLYSDHVDLHRCYRYEELEFIEDGA